MDLLPDARAAIVAWMNVQNASVFRRDSDFGLTNLQFSPSMSNAGEDGTSMSLTRIYFAVSARDHSCTP